MISKLKVGAVTYSVSEITDLHYVDGEGRKRGLNGHIQHDLGTIKIDNALSEDVKLVTLLHEALHGILTVAGQDEQPENMIVPLGYGLAALLRDNPELVALITKGQ